MSALANEFSWSHSRHETFQACLKRYYFAYYASWGGWDDRAPLIAQAVARIGKRWKLDDADREAISGRAGKLWNERMTNWLGLA